MRLYRIRVNSRKPVPFRVAKDLWFECKGFLLLLLDPLSELLEFNLLLDVAREETVVDRIGRSLRFLDLS